MKHMKKSMFISTVMMVVLLVVALSTATFAWFSANSTVMAEQSTMTAATSTSANIQIGWDPADDMGSSITFNDADKLSPMIPKLMPAKNQTQAVQWVATKESNIGSLQIEFEYEGYTGTSLRVVDVDTTATIAIEDVTTTESAYFASEATISGTPLDFSRIYRTRTAKEQHYLAAESTPASESTPFNIGEGTASYLFVIDDAATIGAPNEVKVADLAGYGITEIDNADIDSDLVGKRIYNIKAVTDTFVVVGFLDDAPANFIAGGMEYTSTVTRDYYTILAVQGDITEGSVNLAEAKTIGKGTASAVEGDFIYQVREATGTSATTTYTDFVADFNTSTIDTSSAFRENSLVATPVTLTKFEGGELDNTFYVKNANAPGPNAASATLNMVVTIGGELASDVRVAVFTAPAGVATYNYYGTIASGPSPTNYGVAVKGADSASAYLDTYSALGTTLNNFAVLSAQEYIGIRMVVWYDGVELGSADAGKDVNLSITISAT